jgi:hypothetical protein
LKFLTNSLATSRVIPAKAGIQQEHTLRVADKTLSSGYAGNILINALDSSIRWNDGVTTG